MQKLICVWSSWKCFTKPGSCFCGDGKFMCSKWRQKCKSAGCSTTIPRRRVVLKGSEKPEHERESCVTFKRKFFRRTLSCVWGGCSVKGTWWDRSQLQQTRWTFDTHSSENVHTNPSFARTPQREKQNATNTSGREGRMSDAGVELCLDNAYCLLCLLCYLWSTFSAGVRFAQHEQSWTGISSFRQLSQSVAHVTFTDKGLERSLLWTDRIALPQKKVILSNLSKVPLQWKLSAQVLQVQQQQAKKHICRNRKCFFFVLINAAATQTAFCSSPGI